MRDKHRAVRITVSVLKMGFVPVLLFQLIREAGRPGTSLMRNEHGDSQSRQARKEKTEREGWKRSLHSWRAAPIALTAGKLDRKQKHHRATAWILAKNRLPPQIVGQRGLCTRGF